jgi:hypothetical protein
MDALWIYFRTILDLKWIFVKMSNAFFSNLFVNEALRLLGRWARWALPAGVVIGDTVGHRHPDRFTASP